MVRPHKHSDVGHTHKCWTDNKCSSCCAQGSPAFLLPAPLQSPSTSRVMPEHT